MLARQALIIGTVVVLIIVIIVGGYIIWQSGYFNPTVTPSPSVTPSPTTTPLTTPTPTSSATPEASTPEQVRDAAMTYIKTNHNETTQYMLSVSWTGGRTTPSGIVGAETYSYQSEGWNVTMQYPVVPNPIFTVTADYISPVSQVTPAEKIVSWLGTWQNGTISETSYNNTMLPIQEQVRNNVMAYLKSKHAETSQYMQNFSWTGGDVTPSGLVGSSTYSYLSSGWNVTMQYPVVPDSIYTVTADYNSSGISITWKGTWQNSTITETSYTDNLITTQAEIRDAAMAYIVANHTEAAHLLVNLTWTGGHVDEGVVGSVLYQYNSTGWTVDIRNPVVPNPIYTITANYSSGASTVTWAGTLENRAITETSYTATNLTAQLSEQEQVRESVMAFLKAYRSESAQFMENLFWTGGQTTPGGIVGSETYRYESKLGMFIYSWALEIKYPVVLNPIYTISANYTGIMTNIVAWQGKWQAGVITETSYTYTP
jgi:hypothetical protein